MSILFLLLISVIPQQQELVLRQHVDLIEVNHFMIQKKDDFNKTITIEESFQQLLFRRWSPQHKKHVMIAWRLIKSESQYPVQQGQGYVVRFHDSGVLREITSTNRCETWTLYDPEVLERGTISEDDRDQLKKANGIPIDDFINGVIRAVEGDGK